MRMYGCFRIGKIGCEVLLFSVVLVRLVIGVGFVHFVVCLDSIYRPTRISPHKLCRQP